MHFSKQMLAFVKGERKDARLLSDEVRQVRGVFNATEYHLYHFCGLYILQLYLVVVRATAALNLIGFEL